jgi:UPF0755 protein
MAEPPDLSSRSPPSTQTTPPAGSGRRWSPRSAREAIQPATPPEPPRQTRRHRGGGFLGKLSALFTFALVLMGVAAAGVYVGRGHVTATGPLTEDKIVNVPRNLGRAEIAQLLETEGVITQPLLFEFYTLFSGGALKAGEYQFKQGASLKDVRDVLSDGRSILHSVTIPEGLTSEQIVQRLNENEILVGTVRNMPREGSLLPDTHRFGRGTTREQLISRMEQDQRRVVAEIWARRAADLPLKSPSDLVILASIVEKETGRSDERTRVASVFINRLNRGMRLESDPTIIYGIAGGKGTLGRPILGTEIRAPTPYNTYVINGLPPGPIANPGRASLEATANPSRTRDLFFVADGTGGHAFAETYEQHQRNVARWRQIERGETSTPAQGATPAPAAPTPAGRPAPVRGQQRTELGPARLAWNPAATAPPVAPSAGRVAPAPLSPAQVGPFSMPAIEPEAVANALGYVGNLPAQDELPDGTGAVETFPLAPGRRQEILRNAAQAGVRMPEASAPVGEEPRRPPATAARTARAFDAVEGTSRDPLLNRSFDLNSPKTVPTLR